MAKAYQCDICKKLFAPTDDPIGTFKIGVKRTSIGGSADSPITGQTIFSDGIIFYDVCPSCLDSITIHCSALRHQEMKGDEDNG